MRTVIHHPEELITDGDYMGVLATVADSMGLCPAEVSDRDILRYSEPRASRRESDASLFPDSIGRLNGQGESIRR